MAYTSPLFVSVRTSRLKQRRRKNKITNIQSIADINNTIMNNNLSLPPPNFFSLFPIPISFLIVIENILFRYGAYCKSGSDFVGIGYTSKETLILINKQLYCIQVLGLVCILQILRSHNIYLFLRLDQCKHFNGLIDLVRYQYLAGL